MMNRSGSPFSSLRPAQARKDTTAGPDPSGARPAGAEAGVQAPRRAGPLVWLHVGSELEALGVPDLIDRLRDEREDIAVLVTVTRRGPDELLASRLPRDADVQRAPGATLHAVTAFLEQWRPDVCIWADNTLEPLLINATGKAGIPMFLVDWFYPNR